MKILLDLPSHINRRLKIHKAINGFATLQEAAIDIINKHETPKMLLDLEDGTE